MQMDIRAGGRFGVCGLVLFVALALALTAGPGTPTAGASKEDPTASVAKKKKKKKKKKKSGTSPTPTLPVPTPGGGLVTPPAPTISNIDDVVLSWCNIASVDLDLHVWNSNGQHSGWTYGAGASFQEQIPGGMQNGDAAGDCGGGPTPQEEEFTDTNANSHLITIGVCYAGFIGAGITPYASFSFEIHHTNGTTDVIQPPGSFTTLDNGPGDSRVVTNGPNSYVPGNFCNV
jgi:hypothetical protein